MNKTQKIKAIVAKIDIDKIANYLSEQPKSKLLKEKNLAEKKIKK